MTLLRDVEVDGRRCDVAFTDRITAVAPHLPGLADLDGAGGALLPGLHDHHLHLLALGAARRSVDLTDGLAGLATAPGTGWVRAVNAPAGLSAADLDRVQPSRPVRAQHASGAAWLLNSAALAALDATALARPGVERDGAGRPTGWLHRLDRELAGWVGRDPADLPALGRELALLGLTGLTDATPDLDRATCALLRAGVPQRLQLLGDPDGHGPVKLILDDRDLPAAGALAARIRAVRPRPVAVHCVSRVSLLLLLAVLDDVGRLPGDRIEHAAVVPTEVRERLPTVVTQPGFLAGRGDRWLRDTDPDDVALLYPHASLLAAGVRVAVSSDAPYGPVDPWQAIRAATQRRTASGVLLGGGERVDAATALEGYLCTTPSGPRRWVRPGAPADLVLLAVPLGAALADPDAGAVRHVWLGGDAVA